MKKLIIVSCVLILLLAAVASGYYFNKNSQQKRSQTMIATKTSTAELASTPLAPAKRDLLNTEFRAIYITSWTAGIKRFYALTEMMGKTELNAVVIDIKDSTGRVGYDSKVPMVAEIGAYERRINNLEAILKHCRERKIYTIARIAVFQDPHLAKAKPELAIGNKGGGAWKDRKGLAWVDPAAKTVWDYNLAIAKEAAERGFDEVQFDYVRFPTDGRLKSLNYPVYRGDIPKYEVIRNFFQYVDQQLKPVNVLVSADIFGLTTMAEDDLNIGQRIEDIAPYVDYVCPMIYPSHYPSGHLGLKRPGEHPYRVIYDACMRGLQRLEGKRARMRPWLQDFKLGGDYDKKMIIDQMQAARDAKVFGFSMWNARNVYTEEAYLGKLPQANPNPPLQQELLAEFARKKQLSSAAEANRPDKQAPAEPASK